MPTGPGSQGSVKVEQDESMPMPGEDAIPLTSRATEHVINKGVEGELAIRPCKLAAEPNVSLHLSARELVETHIGVFGFTGTGKSNLVSTLVAEMLSLDWNLRVVIMDYMFEYFPLLADVFRRLDHALLLLDFERVPGGQTTLQALSDRPEQLKNAASILVRSMTRPKRLRSPDVQQALESCMLEALMAGKVNILMPHEPTGQYVAEELRGILGRYPRDWIGAAYHAIISWIAYEIEAKDSFKPEELEQLSEFLRECASLGRFSFVEQAPRTGIAAYIKGRPVTRRVELQISRTAASCLREMAGYLQSLARIWKLASKVTRRTTLDELIDLISGHPDAGEKRLVILYSESPDRLRYYFAELALGLYERRRVSGQNEPPILLVVDEADEFAPGEAHRLGPIYERSRMAAETIARRGRKLGLGLCIATQRTAYLDTRMMGQLHTYFVSKLPREYDRKAVADAYGVDRAVIDQALRFPVGQWLVISHTATGLASVPIPATFPNAEDRVLKGLQDLMLGNARS